MTTTTVILPPLVDSDGNIEVNGRSGVSLLINFTDANNVPTNVAGRAIYFEVKSRLRVLLQAGQDNYSRTLVLDDGQVEALGLKDPGPYFVLRDETSVPPQVLWEGTITARNFNTQPPAGPA